MARQSLTMKFLDCKFSSLVLAEGDAIPCRATSAARMKRATVVTVSCSSTQESTPAIVDAAID
eukprot:470647-Amphidinium_carterae.2